MELSPKTNDLEHIDARLLWPQGKRSCLRILRISSLQWTTRLSPWTYKDCELSVSINNSCCQNQVQNDVHVRSFQGGRKCVMIPHLRRLPGLQGHPWTLFSLFIFLSAYWYSCLCLSFSVSDLASMNCQVSLGVNAWPSFCCDPFLPSFFLLYPSRFYWSGDMLFSPASTRFYQTAGSSLLSSLPQNSNVSPVLVLSLLDPRLPTLTNS